MHVPGLCGRFCQNIDQYLTATDRPRLRLGKYEKSNYLETIVALHFQLCLINTWVLTNLECKLPSQQIRAPMKSNMCISSTSALVPTQVPRDSSLKRSRFVVSEEDFAQYQ